MSYLFTSESVSEGHPDKVADQISDALIDNFLAFDKNSKVACETLVTTGQFDVASTTDMSKKLSERIKQSKYIEIPNGRHLCNIECDEVFNKILEGFIDKNYDQA